MTAPPPVVTIKDEWGTVVCEWQCPSELWIDMQAFATVTGLTIDQLIDRALVSYFHGLQARVQQPRTG